MDRERNFIIQLYLVLFILYSFIIGGFIQYFLGFSNTILTFFGVYSFLLLYLFHSKLKVKKIGFDYFLLIVIMIVYTFIISIINRESIIKPILYSLFFLIPLVIYYLINNSKPFLKSLKIKKILLYIAILQLPILLIQNYFYDFLIELNNSSQQIAQVDFTFGSFFLKNDHALGFFLVVNILYIWTYPILKNKNQRNIVTLILILNLLLSNSNTSILYLFGAISILIFIKRKSILDISIKKVFYLLMFLSIMYFLVVLFEPKFYLDLQNKLSNSLDYRSALKWYKDGIARREQIIVVLLKDGLNYFGHGAYTYFDLLKGDFKGVFRHFSQLIWLYYDLGLVGLSLFFIFIYKTNKLFMKNSSAYSLYLTLGLLLYSFFTIVTFDISFMLTYFIYRYHYEN
ncbi:MAG: hypothetical protein L3J34_02630 [Flavobacteriaceae bacterium]|nr:hypothetical protein [Flavobacteriaceae bacterium]